MAPLSHVVALVTGASGSVGTGICQVLSQCGADIAIHYYSNRRKALALCRDLRALGRRCGVFQADLSQPGNSRRLIQQVARQMGSLHVLVNNAGLNPGSDWDALSPAEWKTTLNVNLTSCLFLTKYALLLMKQARSGRIINVSSVSAERGSRGGYVSYSAAKSGVLGLTKSYARVAAPFGVTVNAIAPGLVDTESSRRLYARDAFERLAADSPLGLPTARDIGLAVAFLAGEGGRRITGATLDVNGGTYMR